MVAYTNKSISGYTPSEIRGIQSKDKTANSIFLRSCEFIVASYASKFAKPKTFHYDDLMQTGRLAALESAWQFEIGKGNFAGYITTSIRNAIYTVGRQRRYWSSLLVNESDLNPEQKRFDYSTEHDGFAKVDREDALSKIKSKISEWRKTLSPKKNQVLDLLFGRGMNQSQAASKMGLSRQNISKMLIGILENGRVALADLEVLN